MGLTEFLLARIAEEDANVSDCGCIQGGRVPDALVNHRVAECEAKRRIVEQISNLQWVGSYAVRDFVLENLAQPYADHPDYRDEWRASEA